MKDWGYSTNSYYKLCHICLDEGPWWAFWLLDVVPGICGRIPDWRVPFLGRVKIVRDGETHLWRDYIGDTLQDIFCLYIDHPLCNLVNKRIKHTFVDITWDECRKLFYDEDKDFWDDRESDPEFGKFEGKTVAEAMASMRDEEAEPSG